MCESKSSTLDLVSRFEMDESKMLSGAQLVVKGATKKVDGQLPEVGVKDVTPNGSWLEQKQIQSALEARKHLVAVERIEKSGSLTHAQWRDDLKLAEVTKQTGGYWQYIGHKRGSFLYLLPEETLFLMETNCLLLKHNDVTVSLQKAYSLCLSEITIMQYKVYASLSRVGYRVLRHKDPKTDKINRQDVHIEATEIVEHPENNDPLPMDTEQVSLEPHNIANNKITIENDAAKAHEKDIIIIDNTPARNVQVNNKVANTNEETVTGGDSTTTNDNTNTEKETSTISDHNITVVNDTTSKLSSDKPVPILDVVTNNLSNTNKSAESRMDIDDNANETVVTNLDNANTVSDNRDTVNGRKVVETVARDSEPNVDVVEKTSNALADVYAIDEFGVIRVFEKNAVMEIDSVDSNVNVATESVDGALQTKDSNTNESFKHYQEELKHYDEKIKKLTERKNNDPKNNHALESLQDFFKRQIVTVDVPDEKYLPRNIFLHKTTYTLNMEVVRTQNASNVASDDADSIGSSSTPAPHTNSQRLTGDPHFGSFNTNRQPRFLFRRAPNCNSRPNYNNFMHRPVPSFYGHPNAYMRQHYMVYNVNLPGGHSFNNPSRQDVIKKYHYDMIVNIAMRLKNSQRNPGQIRALDSLVNTFNLRYDTQIRLTHNFNIIGTLDAPDIEKVVDLDDDKVITLKDEPLRKKPRRLNEDNMKYNNNLAKLKELAAKLKNLHAKDLAVSRHRRVFSNAIKTFNKSFNADIFLDNDFELIDRKTVVVDTSSESEVTVVNDKEKSRKRKKLRNPYSILKHIAKDVNVGASTSHEVPVLRTLSLNVINDTNQNTTDNANTDSNSTNNRDELKRFYQARFAGSDEFGEAKLCSLINARLDALLFQAEYLEDVLKESLEEFESWVDIKLAILKDIRGNLNLEKQQVEALSNDFFTTESRLQPIIGPDCTDLKTALKKLAIIPTNNEIPAETSLRIHYDVCNRDVHFKKTNPPKPNFRVVCYDESAPFPSAEDVVALQAKYTDGVPTVFAFVGVSASISYLQINPIDLPVFIPDNDSVN